MRLDAKCLLGGIDEIDRREYCEECAMIGAIVSFVIDELILRRFGRKKNGRGQVQDGG